MRPLALAVDARRTFLDSHPHADALTPGTNDRLAYQLFIAVRFERRDDTAAKDLRTSYANLISQCVAQFEAIPIAIQFHDDDPTPKNAAGCPLYGKLIDQVETTGVLHVYRSDGSHPILDAYNHWHGGGGRLETMNSIFRAVHDFYGHLASGGHFGWEGETTAYYSHAEMFTEIARPALFSETVGQQCYYAVNRDYTEQKCVSFEPKFFCPPL